MHLRKWNFQQGHSTSAQCATDWHTPEPLYTAPAYVVTAPASRWRPSDEDWPTRLVSQIRTLFSFTIKDLHLGLVEDDIPKFEIHPWDSTVNMLKLPSIPTSWILMRRESQWAKIFWCQRRRMIILCLWPIYTSIQIYCMDKDHVCFSLAQQSLLSPGGG